MEQTQTLDPRAPMSSAPMKYKPDQSVDWGNMWDSYCALAQTGGPPHRGTMLMAPTNADASSEEYQRVAAEIIRGVHEVSGLAAQTDAPGWIAITCASPGMAHWLKNAILSENVEARERENVLLVPCGQAFTVKGEIKNVITVVAKTTHYWVEHVPPELQRAQDTEVQLDRWLGRLNRLLRRNPTL